MADDSPGFIWRLKEEDSSLDNVNPHEKEQIIINLSVWESVETLRLYVYETVHTDFLRRRKEWFQRYGKAQATMWWIQDDQLPTVKEGLAKLSHYENHGSSVLAFDFRNRFEKPVKLH